MNCYQKPVYKFAVDKETDRVEWVKALQAAVEKASSNERISLMANLTEVFMFCMLCRFVIILTLIAMQSRRTEALLQKHLFKQDAFAERFQTKFDQETVTSEVLNSRCGVFCFLIAHLDVPLRRLDLPDGSLLKDIFHCTLQVTHFIFTMFTFYIISFSVAARFLLNTKARTVEQDVKLAWEFRAIYT